MNLNREKNIYAYMQRYFNIFKIHAFECHICTSLFDDGILENRKCEHKQNTKNT